MAEIDQARELRDIKMLLVLQLLSAGVRQRQIASALGISEATMSRMLPKGLSAAVKSEG
jgi:DNA-binding transcriptional regulator LsrR (DeoR family)